MPSSITYVTGVPFCSSRAVYFSASTRSESISQPTT